MRTVPWINKNIAIQSMHIKTGNPPLFSWCPTGSKSLAVATDSAKIKNEFEKILPRIELMECDAAPNSKLSFELSSKYCSL